MYDIGVKQVKATGQSAREPFGGSVNTTKNFATPMNGFVIKNDGASDLTFTLNGVTFTVKAGEQFDESFDQFTQVTVNTAAAFRAYGRG